jgi:hypothetical protein
VNFKICCRDIALFKCRTVTERVKWYINALACYACSDQRPGGDEAKGDRFVTSSVVAQLPSRRGQSCICQDFPQRVHCTNQPNSTAASQPTSRLRERSSLRCRAHQPADIGIDFAPQGTKGPAFFLIGGVCRFGRLYDRRRESDLRKSRDLPSDLQVVGRPRRG